MRTSELLLIPNLLSLSRIALTPVVGYFLWSDESGAVLACVLLLGLAGITDALDGWTARKLNMRSELGLILDPLADKIFAAVLIGELIVFRGFPVWLASLIIGRDLIIMLAGLVLLGKRRITIGSTLTGKYTFFWIVVLIGCSVIRFEAGVWISAVPTLLLLVASLAVYARYFRAHVRGEEIVPTKDKLLYQLLRVGSTILMLALLLWTYLAEHVDWVPHPW